MNIFVTHSCPKKSAKFIDNKRKVKMILESTQLLSTALNMSGISGPYKPTHINHPCAVWTRLNRNNFIWLVEYLSCLLELYTKKYNKIHKCQQYVDFFKQSVHVIPNGEFNGFVNCAGNKEYNISYVHIKDVHKAYRLYLRHRWKSDKYKLTW